MKRKKGVRGWGLGFGVLGFWGFRVLVEISPISPRNAHEVVSPRNAHAVVSPSPHLPTDN
ncbi:hypothetical protein OA58_21765 [Microcystis aeruginosa NIES-88]|nr:hypothetical protein OA58_21765 [Microcystis aeruginosa NIES-88]